MEAVEAFLEGEWDSLSKLFSCEDSDLLLHCNGANFFSFDVESPSNLSHANSNNLDHSSFHDNGFDESMGRSSVFHDDLVEEILQLKAQAPCNDQPGNGPKASEDSCKEMQLKKTSHEGHISSQSSKKRPRVAREGKGRKEAETKKARKGSKISYNDGVVKQSSSSCSSERDDFDASETSESKGSTPMSKIKDSKSPASDSQSLYARKRREKINERLRILQNLVPNGTKVDISTMLEEAVHYVKFLQLQIKLLSSDDTWMYAPIAYNGMDMGLYQRIIPNV